MALDQHRYTFVVYDPPKIGFPYLAAAFAPGKDEPAVTPFRTAAEAEAYNKLIASELLKKAAS